MLNQLDYNPDVLSCLANLSSDEVFTPPSLANQMLDLLPDSLWRDPNAKFLDPAVKSGVFLREIARRLMDGLAGVIPDEQKRRDHIFTRQIYGLAITELTALLARRSVYCSKTANGKYSVAGGFRDEAGNILFERIDHDWKNGRCVHCGASESEYARGAALETHAYAFIHMTKPEEVLGMKFDVIIGNPPYQLSDGGAEKSASPIYQLFIEQAIKLNPRFLSMIVPARWYSGGKGLDEFRNKILNDERLSEIHDFPETSDLFSGLNIRGGVCYFLWEREHKGYCKITNYRNGEKGITVERPLLEEGNDVFIRYNEAIPILRKVRAFNEGSFMRLVSSRKPFGLPTNFNEFSEVRSTHKNILLYRFGKNGFISTDQVEKNKDWIDQYKVIVPYASPGSDIYPHLVLSKPIVAEPGSICTETYLVVGPFDNKQQANNAVSYMVTNFFRFMLLLKKNTQHVTQNTYYFVPEQELDQEWDDKKLYTKYGITDDEMAFISTLVKPLEANGG